MDKCVELNSVDKIREFCQKLDSEGQKKDQIRSCLERSLSTRALFIGPSYPINEVDDFLQFVILLAKEGFCGVSFTVQILQDMFDVSLIKRCEELFTIVEKSIAVFKTDFFFNPCKNLILRMCNDLLKRLSRTVNTAFCGRIIVLLAKSLPLNERSGLNLPGHYNTDNTTFYEQDGDKMGGEQPEEEEEDDRDEGELREKDSNIAVNYALYVKFWDIQAHFANPNLLNDANTFNKFENALWDVLTVFSTYKLERPGSSSKAQADDRGCSTTPSRNGIIDYMSVDGNDTAIPSSSKLPEEIETDKMLTLEELELEDNFFTKYLTSQKLFNLQLADSQFRRYFLVQCLILMNCLTSKSRTKDNFAAVQDSFLKDVTDKCYLLLKETYPHGSHFAESVRRILIREKLWINWKSDGCADVVESLLGRQCKAYKKRPVDRFNPNVIDLSNVELTRLWNINPNNMAACMDAERNCVPELKKFIEDGLDELDPDQRVEETYKSVNNENYQWVASRFLLANSDHYMSCAAMEMKASSRPTSKFLEQAINMTALNMPELNEKAENIQKRMKEIEEEKAAEIIRQAEEEKMRLQLEAEQAARLKAEAEEAAAKARQEAEKARREEEERQKKEKRAELRREEERMKKEEQALKARLEAGVAQKAQQQQQRKTASIKKEMLDESMGSVTADKHHEEPTKSSVTRKEKDRGPSAGSRDSKRNTAQSISNSTSSTANSLSTKNGTTTSSRNQLPPEPVTPGTPSSTTSASERKIESGGGSAKKRKAEKADKAEILTRAVKIERHDTSPPQQKTVRRNGSSKK